MKTYDDWKTTDDTPEPEPEYWCEGCEHDPEGCDCPCCNEVEIEVEGAMTGKPVSGVRKMCADCETESRTGTGQHAIAGETCWCPCHKRGDGIAVPMPGRWTAGLSEPLAEAKMRAAAESPERAWTPPTIGVPPRVYDRLTAPECFHTAAPSDFTEPEYDRLFAQKLDIQRREAVTVLHETALLRINVLMDAESGTDEAQELDLLTSLVQFYERDVIPPEAR